MKLLVTGGAGFIGSNFIHYFIQTHPNNEIINLDKLTYSGNLNNLRIIEKKPGYQFIKGDITDRDLVNRTVRSGIDAVINFAAESHVDRSILDASPFIDTNIKGTQVLLEAVKKYEIKKFIQVSTDEVYGSIDKGSFNEQATLSPSSPYSATKASSDLLCIAYWKTHKTPIVISRCTNNFGPYQFPEKLIPLTITNALENKEIPVYGDGSNKRDWLFVSEHCRALDKIIHNGVAGEIYNIGSGEEKTNIEVITKLLELLGKSKNLMKFVSDRPGHDQRYALDIIKISRSLHWKPHIKFEEALSLTVEWYIHNQSWWKDIKNGSYLQYYKRLYSNR